MDNTISTFQVSDRSSGRLRTVRVKVYDNLNYLRRDANRYDNTTTLVIDSGGGNYQESGWADEALAVAHTRISSDGSYAGLIRLWRQRLGTSVVVHEVTHMALGIYRVDCEETLGSVYSTKDNEEVLCYLIGNLTSRIVGKLYSYGCYD